METFTTHGYKPCSKCGGRFWFDDFCNGKNACQNMKSCDQNFTRMWKCLKCQSTRVQRDYGNKLRDDKVFLTCLRCGNREQEISPRSTQRKITRKRSKSSPVITTIKITPYYNKKSAKSDSRMEYSKHRKAKAKMRSSSDSPGRRKSRSTRTRRKSRSRSPRYNIDPNTTSKHLRTNKKSKSLDDQPKITDYFKRTK